MKRALGRERKDAWQRQEAFKEVGEGTMSLRSKTLHPQVFGRAKPCTSGFRGARCFY